MIRVAALYPNKSGTTFNHDYYLSKHVPMVKKRLGAALVGAEIDRGIGTVTPGAPAPFHAIGYMTFKSAEDFQKVMGVHGQELMADIPNYYSGQPEFQISEIVKG